MKLSRHLLVFCVLSIAQLSFAQTESNLEKANALVKQRQYDEAIKLFDIAVKGHADNWAILQKRGYAHFKLKDWTKAKSDFQRAISQNTQCAECYGYLAQTEGYMGNYEQAFLHANKAIEVDDSNHLGYISRAMIYDLIGQVPKAKQDYNKAVEVSPEEPMVYEQRGYFYRGIGNTKSCLEDFNTALAIDSNLFQVYYVRVRLYSEQQRWEETLWNIDQCLRLDPKNSEHYASKGVILIYLNRLNDAVYWLQKGIGLGANDINTYSNLVYAQYNNGDIDGCCSSIKEASERSPNEWDQPGFCDPAQADFYAARGMTFFTKQEYLKASEILMEGTLKFPESYAIKAWLAMCYNATGEYKAGNALFKQCLLHKDDVVAESIRIDLGNERRPTEQNALLGSHILTSLYMNAAESYAYQLDSARALGYADTSIQMLQSPALDGVGFRDERLSANNNIIGVIHGLKGNHELALKHFNLAIEQDSLNAIAMANLSALYVNTFLGENSLSLQYQLRLKPFHVWPAGNLTTITNSDRKVLEMAQQLCNDAIAIKPNFGFAYLVRAHARMLLQDVNYCEDLTTAEKLDCTGPGPPWKICD